MTHDAWIAEMRRLFPDLMALGVYKPARGGQFRAGELVFPFAYVQLLSNTVRVSRPLTAPRHDGFREAIVPLDDIWKTVAALVEPADTWTSQQA